MLIPSQVNPAVSHVSNNVMTVGKQENISRATHPFIVRILCNVFRYSPDRTLEYFFDQRTAFLFGGTNLIAKNLFRRSCKVPARDFACCRTPHPVGNGKKTGFRYSQKSVLIVISYKPYVSCLCRNQFEHGFVYDIK